MGNRNETRDEYTQAGKRMLKAMAKLKDRPYVKVGFPASTDKPHKRGTGDKVSQGQLVKQLLSAMGSDLVDPITIVELAIVHEFGSDDGRIPERGPIRATHDKKQREWWEMTSKLKLLVLTHQISVKKALGLLGQRIKADIQSAYRRGGDPYVKNAPATIKAKGSSKPLIDTGQLLNSVNYERVNAD